MLFLATFVSATVLWVIVYRFVNPPITLLMISRHIEKKDGSAASKTPRRWISIDSIPECLKLSVMAGEDHFFLKHHGFDFAAMKLAFHGNQQGRSFAGGSTISQQTAKNTFLWATRSWTRKIFEAYFTVLIEVFWSKNRIMEVYLNEIELGDGIYGIVAASNYYYHKPVSRLNLEEAIAITSIIPAPLEWTPLDDNLYLSFQRNNILYHMHLYKWVK